MFLQEQQLVEEEQQQMNGEEFLTHSSCSLQELEMILKRKLQLFPIPFINNACISLIEEILREIGMYVVPHLAYNILAFGKW